MFYMKVYFDWWIIDQNIIEFKLKKPNDSRPGKSRVPPSLSCSCLTLTRIDTVYRTVEHIKLKQAEKPEGLYAGFKE